MQSLELGLAIREGTGASRSAVTTKEGGRSPNPSKSLLGSPLAINTKRSKTEETESNGRAAMLALLPLCAVAAGSDGFICDGGRVHPVSHVNDDYCDCSDGSDERATGACPDTTFRCENSPHVASVLFASRVNDGVCDCCDGSDETRVTERADAAGGARAPLCPNRCVSLASEAVGSLVRGLKERGERSRAGQEEAAQRGERVLQARGELAETEAEMREATAHLTRAEEVEAERMAERVRRLEGGEVERAIRLDEMTQEQLARALVQLALAQQVHGVDKLHEMLSAEAAEEMEEVDAADLMEVSISCCSSLLSFPSSLFSHHFFQLSHHPSLRSSHHSLLSLPHPHSPITPPYPSFPTITPPSFSVTPPSSPTTPHSSSITPPPSLLSPLHSRYPHPHSHASPIYI